MNTSSTNTIPLFWVIPIIGFGLLFAAVGLFLGWSSWQESIHALRVEGTVARIVQLKAAKPQAGSKIPESPQPRFVPEVEYQVGPQRYRISGQVSSSTPAYTIGEKVVIRYRADQPAAGRIDSFTENWLGPIAFTGGGFLFGLIGCLLFRARLRANAAKQQKDNSELPNADG